MAEQKKIVGYSNYYISADGRVWSIYKNDYLIPHNTRQGYPVVVLYANKKSKTFLVHRLVAEHFIKKTNPKHTVNHINGIKTDNRVENLEWLSLSDNIKHAWKNGRKQSKKARETSYALGYSRRSLSFSIAQKIRKLWASGKHTQKEIGKMFGVGNTVIYKIVNNKTYISGAIYG